MIRNSEELAPADGASTVRLWPRLVAVIDPRYAALIDDAKTNLDFMVNCAVLFFVAAVLTIVAAWQGDIKGVSVFGAGLRVLFFCGLIVLAYAAAIERARSWGGLVKASVDLYRRELSKKLEYTYTFTDVHDERKRFWEPLSALWVFPDLRDEMDVLPFAQPVPIPTMTSASSENTVPLTVMRA